MNPDPLPYTPYEAVNILLHRLRTDVEAILGAELVGIYLYGSLSLGDFNPTSSDVDFLVVTQHELSQEQIAALQKMHTDIAASALPFAQEIEGSYIPRAALRCFNPNDCHHPYINSHDEQGITLRVEHHGQDWDIQRHIVREHGVVLVGPPPDTLIDPIAPQTIQAGVRELLFGWWGEVLAGTLLSQEEYQRFAIQTMCRMLYTFEHGTIASKPVAMRWALATLEPRWASLIEWAVAYIPPPPDQPIDDIRDLIQYVMARAKSHET